MKSLNQYELKGEWGGGKKEREKYHKICPEIQVLVWFSSFQCRFWCCIFCPGSWARSQTWLPIPYVLKVTQLKTMAHPTQSQRKCLQLASSTIAKCHSILNLLFPICSQRTGKVGAGGFLLVGMDRAHVEKLPVMSDSRWLGLHQGILFGSKQQGGSEVNPHCFGLQHSVGMCEMNLLWRKLQQKLFPRCSPKAVQIPLPNGLQGYKPRAEPLNSFKLLIKWKN